MKVILLGHSGFIGSALFEYFERFKNYEITGYSLPEINLLEWESVKKLEPEFNREVNLIFASGIKRQIGDDLDTFNKNMIMTQNVCRLIANKPINRLIYLSSAAVYGEEKENINITEDTNACPSSYYGIAKYASEMLLKKICMEKGIKNFTALRPAAIYGLGDGGFDYGPASFVQKAQLSEKIILWGDGSEKREFIYIQDVCEIFEKLLNVEFFGHLNLVSGVSYNFIDIINILRESFPSVEIESKKRTKLKVDHQFNASLLDSVLGGRYNFSSLRVGINRMLDANS